MSMDKFSTFPHPIAHTKLRTPNCAHPTAHTQLRTHNYVHTTTYTQLRTHNCAHPIANTEMHSSNKRILFPSIQLDHNHRSINPMVPTATIKTTKTMQTYDVNTSILESEKTPD